MKKSPVNILMVFLIISLLLAACGPASADLAQARLPRVTNPDASDSDLKQLAGDNTAFCLDLYKSLRSEGGNLFYSPYSISLALAMTYAGARGETATQMASTLHFTLPDGRLHPAFNALDLELAKRPQQSTGSDPSQKDFELNIVNALWGQKGWSFLPEYLDLLASNYGAGLRLLDYKKDPEKARQSINDWVAQQTKDKIKDLLPEGLIDPATTLVLVNAIYFKAGWEYDFSDTLTQKQPFTLLDGSQVQVPLMSYDEANPLGYARGDGWQAVALPYKGEAEEMIILLPDAGQFDKFEQGLNPGRLDEILTALEVKSVALSMPKFGFTSELRLKKSLSAMGMPLAFDENQADFSGMDGKHLLYILDAVHKAFVKVDETGTEAAAATGVVMRPTSATVTDVEMKVDRPFLFMIRDVDSGTILFMGRVLDPTK